MNRAFKRSDRVASEVQKQLSLILQRELPNLGLGMISVTEVEMSPDLIYAKAFVTFLDVGDSDKLAPKEKIKVLNSKVPQIRALLAKKVLLRVVPEIKFVYNDYAEKASAINELFEKAGLK